MREFADGSIIAVFKHRDFIVKPVNRTTVLYSSHYFHNIINITIETIGQSIITIANYNYDRFNNIGNTFNLRGSVSLEVL